MCCFENLSHCYRMRQVRTSNLLKRLLDLQVRKVHRTGASSNFWRDALKNINGYL
jgi:hypothetical protein